MKSGVRLQLRRPGARYLWMEGQDGIVKVTEVGEKDEEGGLPRKR